VSTHAAEAVLALHSKSFALATRLLPKACRGDVAVLYAYCRRADDEVDDAPEPERPARVAALFAELDAIYAGRPQPLPLLAEFQRVVVRYRIPETYPRELLEGMRSDLGPVRIASERELLLYAHRVAGVVGLMLCHVFGLQDRRALVNADHLGIAMQLTNICRDVVEDFRRNRVYLPVDLLRSCGATALAPPGGDLAPSRSALAAAVIQLLALAERYYASGDAGLASLSFRVAIAVRAARLVYAEIGAVLKRRGGDALRGRAAVPLGRKLRLVARAVFTETLARLRRSRARPALRGGVGDAH
jgi:phytoene synthase